MIEIIRPDIVARNPRIAIFDFDGTLSLVRSGWMPMMVSMFVEELAASGIKENEADLRDYLQDVVLQLTGKETIYQMRALAAEIEKRGRTPQTADEYKRMFVDRLLKLVDGRLDKLEKHLIDKDDLLVPGARSLLDFLEEQGLVLYLASGTDEENVKHEAAALGIAKYFGDRIYGARTDGRGFTKAALVRHLVDGAGYTAEDLLGFGDGFVEINEVRKAGGIGVGVATDEPECVRIDEGKRRFLLQAHADYIIPNYCELSELLPFILPEHASVLDAASER